jgi:trans-2,3-dihydro-3-hydroxyanthranilate isomerase
VSASGQAAGSSALNLEYVVCDVFTSAPLAGNALAVFPVAPGLEADLRQRLARELNLSETVFVDPAQVDADARLQIHTPDRELPFAGHPLLGTATVLVGDRDADLRLATAAGVIEVEVRTRGRKRASAWMVQPWPRRVDIDAELVIAALGIDRELCVFGYDNGARFAYAELSGPAELASLRPDLGLLSDLGHGLHCFAEGEERWKARMFAPAIGVAEDPATGSAAGPLAVHLQTQGRIASGEPIALEQGAEVGRPSMLEAVVEDAGSAERRVRVGGDVVVVASGRFELPTRPWAAEQLQSEPAP